MILESVGRDVNISTDSYIDLIRTHDGWSTQMGKTRETGQGRRREVLSVRQEYQVGDGFPELNENAVKPIGLNNNRMKGDIKGLHCTRTLCSNGDGMCALPS
jgi:hypothetical protein